MTDRIKVKDRFVEQSDEEVDAIHREIQQDLAAGQGTKHFEDVLDELHSNPSQQHEDASPVTQAEIDEFERDWAEFMRAVKRDVNGALVSQGLMVVNVRRCDGGEGIEIRLRDKAGRRFEAKLSIDEGIMMGQLNGETVYRQIVDTVCKRSLEARDTYHRRAGLQ